MFVFHSEEDPVEPPDDFSDGDTKTCDGRLLNVALEQGIADPLVTEDDVDDHCRVVDGLTLVGQLVSEEEVLGVELEEGPVHEEVPCGGDEPVHGAEDDQHGTVMRGDVHPVQTEAHVVQAGNEVLTHVS